MSAVLGDGKAVDLLVIYIFTMICDDELWPWTKGIRVQTNVVEKNSL